jgi:hypothetical protein
MSILNNYFQNMQMNALINYSRTHTYNYIHNKCELTDDEKKLKIKIVFKQLVTQIRAVAASCNELDRFNTPMAFLFQYLRETIIQLIANMLPLNEKITVESLKYTCSLEANILLYRHLIALEAKDTMLWLLFQVPYYNESQQLITVYRDVYIKTIDWVLSLKALPKFTESEFIFASNETCLPYGASYHNCNNVTLLSKYSQLLRAICPWLTAFSPSLAKKFFTSRQTMHLPQETQQTAQQTTHPPLKTAQYIATDPPRPHQPFPTSHGKLPTDPPLSPKSLCFISDSLATDSSVLRDRIAIVGKLDRTRFNVFFASFIPFKNIKGSVAKTFMNKIKANYIHLGCDITSARSILEPYEFNIIVYLDLGMKLLPTLLAYSRIAPVQITTWGHSETSGIDTIDYFISSKWFEMPEGSITSTLAPNYSEQLIKMNSLSTYYISPHLLFVTNNVEYQQGRKRVKSRDELGFKKDDHIYCCLQTFYKFNVDFELALSKIVDLDPNAVILLSNTFPFCKSHLLRILKQFGERKIAQLKWYGSLEKDEFLNLVAISDVCLDPFPFGGCNTSYDAFDYNIPVITWPSEYLHGRFTFGLYWKMGLENCECIATSREEYVKLAVAISINEKLRHKMNRNIEMKKSEIFQEKESVDEWCCVLESLM